MSFSFFFSIVVDMFQKIHIHRDQNKLSQIKMSLKQNIFKYVSHKLNRHITKIYAESFFNLLKETCYHGHKLNRDST